MSTRLPSKTKLADRAFTLIELLVSMTVLSIIVVLVAQLVNSAAKVTGGNTRHLDADGQARQVFERMTLDFGKMVRRPDADCLFAKLPLQANGSGHDDTMFFYSEVPAFLEGDPNQIPVKSSVALVGYRINKAFQLERLGKLLTWDGTPVTGTTAGGVMFLSSPSAALNPDPASTLAGNWPDTLGKTTDSPPYSTTKDDTDYNVLAEGVFRLEVCYSLQPVYHKDPATGNYDNLSRYSSIPVAAPENVKNDLVEPRPPAASDDVGQQFQAGSRWYDTLDSRGYICTGNTAGAATWKILGMQDVAGIVVTLAVLDGTTSKILPTAQVKLSSSQSQPSTVPNLTGLNSVFSDLIDDQTPRNTGTGNTLTAPDLSLNPPRLVAEAWQNEVNQTTFAQQAGVPQPVAAQVRIYQRYIPLNALP